MFKPKARTLLAIVLGIAIGASAQIVFQNTGGYTGCEDANIKKSSASNNFSDVEELFLYV